MNRTILLSAALAGLTAMSAAHGSPQAREKAARPPSPAKAAGGHAPSGCAAWRSDPRLAHALGPEVRIQGYAMRLPGGYREALPPRGAPGLPQPILNTHVYTRAGLGDGNAPILTVAITPADSANALSLDDAMAAKISPLKHSLRNCVQSPVEHGTIGGLRFARAYFQGTRPGPSGPIAARGVIYVAIDSREIIEMQADASGPDAQAALSLAEAALLTFRKGAME